jgi:hypothetical protein
MKSLELLAEFNPRYHNESGRKTGCGKYLYPGGRGSGIGSGDFIESRRGDGIGTDCFDGCGYGDYLGNGEGSGYDTRLGNGRDGSNE